MRLVAPASCVLPDAAAPTSRQLSRVLHHLAACCCAVIPVRLSDADPEARLNALKKDPEFASSKGFGASRAAAADRPGKTASPSDARWQLAAFEPDSWTKWLRDLEAGKSQSADGFYLQVGSVRCWLTDRVSSAGADPCQYFHADSYFGICIRVRFRAVVHAVLCGTWSQPSCSAAT